MEPLVHDLPALFAQLGMANDELSLHRLLPEAGFWNAAQASFLRDALWNDSDWCEAIDQLDVMLRQPR